MILSFPDLYSERLLHCPNDHTDSDRCNVLEDTGSHRVSTSRFPWLTLDYPISRISTSVMGMHPPSERCA